MSDGTMSNAIAAELAAQAAAVTPPIKYRRSCPHCGVVFRGVAACAKPECLAAARAAEAVTPGPDLLAARQ